MCTYTHPYTGEERPVVWDLDVGSTEMTPCGMVEVFDLTVQDANHYITQSTLVNKNTYIGFDELGQIAEERIWTYLMSRNRPTAPGLTMQMRASANPGGPGHHWLKKRFVEPCPVDGSMLTLETKLPSGRMSKLSRAFVRSKLADNPTLMENDPEYEARLAALPELEYRWLAEGDWNAGAGLALRVGDEHLIAPFDIPAHWRVWGALDWGYNHPFSYGIFACDEDGNVYLVNAATGRHLQPPEIVGRAKAAAGLLWSRIRYTIAGHDVWADVRARSENIPTLAEQFSALGAPMAKASISRIAGVQNLRRYLEKGSGSHPKFRMFDTPVNRRIKECLETRVSDPDNVEDVLKQDADTEGKGGDDAYDMVRYSLASRPFTAEPQLEDAVKDDDRAPTFDWEKRSFKRVDPEQAMNDALGLGSKKHPTVGRHRMKSRFVTSEKLRRLRGA